MCRYLLRFLVLGLTCGELVAKKASSQILPWRRRTAAAAAATARATATATAAAATASNRLYTGVCS
jgi:hypothetical protein